MESTVVVLVNETVIMSHGLRRPSKCGSSISERKRTVTNELPQQGLLGYMLVKPVIVMQQTDN